MTLFGLFNLTLAMSRLNLRCILVLIVLIQYSCVDNAADFQIYDLKHHQSVEISTHFPLNFSWKIKSDQVNWIQDAYQIIVSDSERKINENIGDIWDSGKTLSDDQLYIAYKGKPLKEGKQYYWKVRVWQKDKNSGQWSKSSGFSTPLNFPDSWKAKWITYDYKKESPLPIFRKTFQLDQIKKILGARLYICGLGYYEAYLNGSKIGNRVLEPAQTNYDDYAFYTDYEIPVKSLDKINTLGIMLGNGWYNQNQVWSPAMAYGQPIAIAQLIINYEDGSTHTVGTDDTWKWMPGPIASTNIYAGENYDARLEVPNWCSPILNDQNWNQAKLATNFPPKISGQEMEPILRMANLPVVKIIESSAKTWIFDFGQNFAGWTSLKMKGHKDQKITLRFAEEINQNSLLDPASTGVKATKVVQTDSYTCKGEDTEVWEPRFTYHGFRYVEVTGLDIKPEKELLTGVVVYSSMPTAGLFRCSDAQINKLHDLAIWTIKSNVHSIPTDCPHRERCGWTGDAYTLAPTLIRNFDAQMFLIKYLFDMRSSARETKKELYFGINFQDRSIIPKPAGVPTMIVPGKRTSGIASPDWGTAATQIPWNLYQFYGNLNILREFYPDMKAWVDYISKKFPDYIVNHGLGDWCPPGGNKMIDCPVSLSSTAFHYLDLSILTKTAHLLGYESDAEFYANRLKKVKEQFNEKFFDAEKYSYRSQTANAMAIQLGLVPDGKVPQVVNSLAQDIIHKSNGFIQTGIFGLGRVFPALAENGAEELAFKLFTKTGDHSFANMWEKYDATTLWEVLPVDNRMDLESIRGRSHSHPMNAGFDEWFFKGIAGIHSDEAYPGFKKIVFRPYFTSKLKNAEATYESPYGTIGSKWKWEGKNYIWNIEIPPNSTGLLYIPKIDNYKSIRINGISINNMELIADQNYPGFWVYNKVTNGKYHIEVNL